MLKDVTANQPQPSIADIMGKLRASERDNMLYEARVYAEVLTGNQLEELVENTLFDHMREQGLRAPEWTIIIPAGALDYNWDVSEEPPDPEMEELQVVGDGVAELFLADQETVVANVRFSAWGYPRGDYAVVAEVDYQIDEVLEVPAAALTQEFRERVREPTRGAPTEVWEQIGGDVSPESYGCLISKYYEQNREVILYYVTPLDQALSAEELIRGGASYSVEDYVFDFIELDEKFEVAVTDWADLDDESRADVRAGTEKERRLFTAREWYYTGDLTPVETGMVTGTFRMAIERFGDPEEIDWWDAGGIDWERNPLGEALGEVPRRRRAMEADGVVGVERRAAPAVEPEEVPVSMEGFNEEEVKAARGLFGARQEYWTLELARIDRPDIVDLDDLEQVDNVVAAEIRLLLTSQEIQGFYFFWTVIIDPGSSRIVRGFSSPITTDPEAHRYDGKWTLYRGLDQKLAEGIVYAMIKAAPDGRQGIQFITIRMERVYIGGR